MMHTSDDFPSVQKVRQVPLRPSRAAIPINLNILEVRPRTPNEFPEMPAAPSNVRRSPAQGSLVEPLSPAAFNQVIFESIYFCIRLLREILINVTTLLAVL